MKKIVLLALTAIGFLSISCKEEKKDENTENKKAPVKENFYVEITAQAAKKDDFAVYYTEDGTIEFKPEKALWRGIAANKEETMVIDFPADIIPTHIRLDLGLNKEQDSVTISKIKIGYLDNAIEIKGSQFFDYFVIDNQFKTTVDPSKATITFIKNGTEYKTPYYYPRQELVNKIKQITAGLKATN
ncbi:hypothetical protein CHU92_13045 [Flavobacterium cyanobacteriorum]|uniref:Uncharacterized protein n=1 Tax=Flavobacterium cyanobacteriorum TaxID=2022802 RepID=A0A255YVT4_9FLAO|nr:hypothetical protein [Flavobacterium cyanobacteriorum]OYQ33312.1 hypothetical protein CHU92_13045 [Flavobacterium cyanobacteriorum]